MVFVTDIFNKSNLNCHNPCHPLRRTWIWHTVSKCSMIFFKKPIYARSVSVNNFRYEVCNISCIWWTSVPGIIYIHWTISCSSHLHFTHGLQRWCLQRFKKQCGHCHYQAKTELKYTEQKKLVIMKYFYRLYTFNETQFSQQKHILINMLDSQHFCSVCIHSAWDLIKNSN